jgi:hypothetical protein
MEFKDISDEVHRTYEFPGGDIVTIIDPIKINVSKSGGHRILDAAGTSHYIPPKWIHLKWTVKGDSPAFVF